MAIYDDEFDFYVPNPFPYIDFGDIAKAKAPANSNNKIVKSSDNVRQQNPERWPTMRGKPEVRSTPGTQKEPYFNAKVKREGNKTGKGHGSTRTDAVDNAYQNAGGTPNKSVKPPENI